MCNARRQGEDAATPCLGNVLEKAAAELESVAKAGTRVQWAISSLLERTDHPDIASELHVLQDIDRMQQTVDDLAALLLRCADMTPAVEINPADVLSCLRLDSLRERISSGLSADAGTQNTQHDNSEITWL